MSQHCSSVCLCSQSSMSRLEEQTYTFQKNMQNFMVNKKQRKQNNAMISKQKYPKCVKETFALSCIFFPINHWSLWDLSRNWSIHYYIICKDVAQSTKQRIQVSGLFPIMPQCFLILYLQLFIHSQPIALSASQLLTEEHSPSGPFSSTTHITIDLYYRVHFRGSLP